MAPNDWETGGWADEVDEESGEESEDRHASDDEEQEAADAPGGGSEIPDFEAPDEIGEGDAESGDDDFSVASGIEDPAGAPEADGAGEIPGFDGSEAGSGSDDVPGIAGTDGSTEGAAPREVSGADGVPDFDEPSGERGPESKSAATEAATRRTASEFGDKSESPAGMDDVATDGTLVEGTDSEPVAGFGGDLADPAFEGDAPTIFSSTGIGLAAFIGGPLAAVVLLAYNCRSVGLEERMSSILGVGLLGSAAIFGLVVLLPGLLLPMAGGYIGGSIYYAKQLESEIRTRIEEPVQTYSDAGALGIGCLFSVLMFFLVCAGVIVAA